MHFNAFYGQWHDDDLYDDLYGLSLPDSLLGKPTPPRVTDKTSINTENITLLLTASVQLKRFYFLKHVMPLKDKMSTEKFWTDAQVVLHS